MTGSSAANEPAASGADRLRSYVVSDDLAALDSAVDDFRTAARQSVGHVINRLPRPAVHP
ncbi:hypothetical protein AB0I93_12700 [Streptomyces sp. NPDC049967]|uniref:hypothetical protein n=1 Tax=unclassified Streptomyces TaxID=2593676 RepID=UPI003252B9D9